MDNEYKPPSLIDYAYTILADKRVQAILNAIKKADSVAERLLAVLGEDDEATRPYRFAIIQANRDNLLQIIKKIVPPRWLLMNVELKVGKEVNYEDLPLLAFYTLLTDRAFQPYFLRESAQKLAWFRAPLPVERQLEFVIALFLWLKMDAHVDVKKRRTYYVRALDSGAFLVGGGESSTGLEDISSVIDRRRFLDIFAAYIHTDVWTADEYVQKKKEGTIMRLRFTDYRTGLVVVQTCGDMARQCNTLYKVTDNTLAQLERLYPVPKVTALGCNTCGCLGAKFFHPVEMNGIYCDSLCYGHNKTNI